MKYLRKKVFTSGVQYWDSNDVAIRIDIKPVIAPKASILIRVTDEFFNDPAFDLDAITEKAIKNFSEKDIYIEPGYKLQRKRERHYFLTHGKHGTKYPGRKK